MVCTHLDVGPVASRDQDLVAGWRRVGRLRGHWACKAALDPREKRMRPSKSAIKSSMPSNPNRRHSPTTSDQCEGCSPAAQAPYGAGRAGRRNWTARDRRTKYRPFSPPMMRPSLPFPSGLGKGAGHAPELGIEEPVGVGVDAGGCLHCRWGWYTVAPGDAPTKSVPPECRT